MPYKLSENGLCVYKENTDKSLGEVVKCHDTHEQAVAHLRALYANVPEAKEIAAWGLTDDAASSVGTLRTLFSGKVHDAMTSVTDQLTMRGYLSQEQNKVITDIKGAMLKLFNETIPPDLAEMPILPQTLDEIASKELKESPSTFISIKEFQDSPYQWVMITSSSFKDRDGEIISQKAHEADIQFMEQTGNHGTLDWWHLHPIVFDYLETKERVATLPPSVQQQGVIIGDCTLSAMYGKLRIEAGTYRSKEIADIMNDHADELAGSLLFFRPCNEPDAQGVYHHIRTVSRAIMPREHVSNLAALLSNVQGV